MTGAATSGQGKVARRAVGKRRVRRARGWRAFAGRLRPAEVEAIILLALFGLALIVRWPYLLRLPHFTDELGEVRWALSIWRGEQFPLTAQETYLGALHAYILAGCLWLFGPSVALPRIVVCVIGALTVVATYLLGRGLAGRPVGLLAAALLLTLPQHILVNSHVAWQNSTTPLYTTVALWALAKSKVESRKSNEGLSEARSFTAGTAPQQGSPSTFDLRLSIPRWFLLAGFAYGLALETHPGTIVLAPAMVAAFGWRLWRARAWGVLRTPGPWLGVAAALVAVGPLLGYNLARGLVGVERVQRSRGYAFETDHSPGAYLRNLGNLFLELARMLSDPFRIPARALDYLASPHLVVAVVACLAGLWILARRGEPLPVLALASTALIMPYFNHAYGVDGDRPIVTGRYVAFLLPPLLIASAAAIVALGMRATEWGMGAAGSGKSGGRSGVVPPPPPPILGELDQYGSEASPDDPGVAGPISPQNWGARGGGPPRNSNHLPPRPPTSYFVLRTSAFALALFLVLYPLVPLARYYRDEAARDPANATFLETLRIVREARGPGTPVLLDRNGLVNVDLLDGASALEIIDVLLILDGIPHVVTRAPGDDAQRLAGAVAPGDTAALPLVIMMRDECFRIRDRVSLQRISGRLILRELYPTVPSYYGVYRVAPAGQPGGCLPAGGATPGD